jgi:hypothetical protein
MLGNHKHELFAQGLASGKSATESLAAIGSDQSVEPKRYYGDYPGLDFRRSKPLRWLRQAGCYSVQKFQHFSDCGLAAVPAASLVGAIVLGTLYAPDAVARPLFSVIKSGGGESETGQRKMLSVEGVEIFSNAVNKTVIVPKGVGGASIDIQAKVLETAFWQQRIVAGPDGAWPFFPHWGAYEGSVPDLKRLRRCISTVFPDQADSVPNCLGSGPRLNQINGTNSDESPLTFASSFVRFPKNVSMQPQNEGGYYSDKNQPPGKDCDNTRPFNHPAFVFYVLCFISFCGGFAAMGFGALSMLDGRWAAASALCALSIALAVATVLSLFAAITSGRGHLAAFNRGAENIRILPVVIPELELGDIEGHVFPADLVKRADDTALKDAPKALNRVCMDCADYIAVRNMVNGFVRVIAQTTIDAALVSRKQADLIRDDLADEALSGFLCDVSKYAGNNVALTLHRADDRGFCGRRVLAALPALPSVLVLILSADERFINLDNPAKPGFRLNQGRADFVAHAPSGFVRAEAHNPLNFEGANAFLASQHAMDDAIPFAQGLVRVLKNRAGNVREAIGGLRRAIIALPPVRHCSERLGIGSAARALDAFRPTARDQVRLASVLIGERRLELRDRHLMNWLRAAGHSFSPHDRRKVA